MVNEREQALVLRFGQIQDVKSEPGIYFVGLPWLSRRGSTFIWGVWHDAKHVAGHIATQRPYLAYRDSEQRAADEQQQPLISNVSTLGAH